MGKECMNYEKCNRFKGTQEVETIVVKMKPDQVERICQIFKAKAEASCNYTQQTSYHEQADFFSEILKRYFMGRAKNE